MVKVDPSCRPVRSSPVRWAWRGRPGWGLSPAAGNRSARSGARGWRRSSLLAAASRPRRRIEATRPVTLADRLKPLVTRRVAGTLSEGQHAELERLLIGYWRKRLGLEQASPAEAMTVMRNHPRGRAADSHQLEAMAAQARRKRRGSRRRGAASPLSEPGGRTTRARRGPPVSLPISVARPGRPDS